MRQPMQQTDTVIQPGQDKGTQHKTSFDPSHHPQTRIGNLTNLDDMLAHLQLRVQPHTKISETFFIGKTTLNSVLLNRFADSAQK